MNRRIRSRLIVILCVAALSLGLFASRGINLGLDLRGGVHLVLQVVTDDAVRTATDRAIQSLDPDLEMSTGQVMRLKPVVEGRIRSESVTQTMSVIRNRLDKLGVGEVTIQPYGSAKDYQILVQWPGEENPDRVKSIIHATALLELKLVDAGPFPGKDAALQHYGGVLPSNIDLLPETDKSYYTVKKSAEISGTELKDAYRSRDENGRPAVGFSLTPDGAKRFAQVTEQNIGRVLAVVLDGRIQSAARIETRISDSGIIRGASEDLVVILKSGALPASVRYGEEGVVGPSLGSDSIHKGVTASVVALTLVTTFMLFYYRWAGVNAVLAMVMNLIILLGSMAYFRATLTLPGIAGIILTIGVGIDSNVLIFERIREELRAGHPPSTAVATSFQRVFITLVDTHLAALISAVFLFAFGTGTIQGFAVTLVIGLVSNMFTSVFVSRTLFDWTLSRHKRGAALSI